MQGPPEQPSTSPDNDSLKIPEAACPRQSPELVKGSDDDKPSTRLITKVDGSNADLSPVLSNDRVTGNAKATPISEASSATAEPHRGSNVRRLSLKSIDATDNICISGECRTRVQTTLNYRGLVGRVSDYCPLFVDTSNPRFTFFFLDSPIQTLRSIR